MSRKRIEEDSALPTGSVFIADYDFHCFVLRPYREDIASSITSRFCVRFKLLSSIARYVVQIRERR